MREGVELLGRPRQVPEQTVGTFHRLRGRPALVSCCIPKYCGSFALELRPWAWHYPLGRRASLAISLTLVPRSNLPTGFGFRNPYLPFPLEHSL